MIEWILAAVMVSADVCSDLMLSRGMKQVGSRVDLTFDNLVRVPGRVLRNSSALAAIGLSAVHFFAFLALLSFWDLSIVIPIGALVFVLGTAAARVVLKERVPPMRWIGVCLIALGVAIATGS
jgi:drug/metabolite transporter (DMT)-like permease